ncbi:MAG TPA: hypothetical protein G4O00_12050 [Thermoflexia bacterium]|jgi:hypothetical protein|nr:hypothetical protein [Thermoflexia bacterium]
MNLSRCKHIVFSLVAGGLLLVGFFLIVDGAPRIARADPGDLFVTTDGTGTDCTQANPCSLQTALAQANDGDTVYLATGTYTGTGAAVITVTRNITLYGGWDGSSSGPVVRDPDAYPTTLDGEGTRRVVYINGSITPTVDGFIITGGNAGSVVTDPGRGGGIYSKDAAPIITNNVITNNIAYTGTATYGHGGGICLIGASASALISGNIIIGNTANPVGPGKGGGLTIYGSAATISGNFFQSNVAGFTSNSAGGGLYLGSSPAIVSGNLFRGNKATFTGSGFGGGLHTQFGNVVLSGNIVVSNTSSYGALTFEGNARITMTNNVIARNVGGVFVRGNATFPFAGTLVHNTIVQNGSEGVYVGWYVSGHSSLTGLTQLAAERQPPCLATERGQASRR